MATSIKKRVKRAGPTHRVYVTLTLPTVEALRAEGAKRGYSISALVQQVIERGMAAGLLYAETPSSKVEDLVKLYQSERLAEVYEELRLAMQENIDLSLKEIALQGDLIAQKQQGLEMYAETITDQAQTIAVLQDALRELDGPFVVRDAGQDRKE